MKNPFHLFATFLGLSLMLAACAPSPAATLAPTSTASETPGPTLAPTATETPSNGALEIHAFVSRSGDPVVGLQLYVTQNEETQEFFTDSNGAVVISELVAGTAEYSPVWIIDQTLPASCESPHLEGWKVPGLFIGDTTMAHFFGPGPEVEIQSGETTIVELEFICPN